MTSLSGKTIFTGKNKSCWGKEISSRTKAKKEEPFYLNSASKSNFWETQSRRIPIKDTVKALLNLFKLMRRKRQTSKIKWGRSKKCSTKKSKPRIQISNLKMLNKRTLWIWYFKPRNNRARTRLTIFCFNRSRWTNNPALHRFK